MPEVRILGLDPGAANFGWAVLRLLETTEEPVALGVIRTAPSRRKAEIFRTQDLHARGKEITTRLREIIREHSPLAICAEGLSLPPGMRAASLCGRMWGLLDAVASYERIPILEVSVGELKRAITGSAQATKERVQGELRKRYPSEVISAFIEESPASSYEHAFDALGSIVTCLPSVQLGLLRTLSRSSA